MFQAISYASREMTDEELKNQSSTDALAQGTQYQMTLHNESSNDWTFYVYQKAPQPSADIFSLAWFASPYIIKKGNKIRFTWEIDYTFVWSDTGILQPGVSFDASGAVECSPAGTNVTDFTTKGGPGLSEPTKGKPEGSLVIKDDETVPNNKFSVGIGMSGAGTFAVQAGSNLKHTFTPTPSYWIAAGSNVKVGDVLNIDTVTQTSQVKFPPAVFAMDCVLLEDNTWDINPA